MSENDPQVLLTGVTGFIGGRLVRNLAVEGIKVRCLVRSPRKLPGTLRALPGVEFVSGDLLQADTLVPALEGMDAAYYLVHSMGGRNLAEIHSFAERDRQAAENFVKAAEATGLERILVPRRTGRIGG